MEDGRKAVARRVVSDSLELVKRHQVRRWHEATSAEEKAQIDCNPRAVLRRAVTNCTPMLRLVPVERGGITYQVPCAITPKQAQFRAMQWMRDICRDKPKDVRMTASLSKEILDAYNGEGRVVRKKQEMHKECEANRAYAHYRWK